MRVLLLAWSILSANYHVDTPQDIPAAISYSLAEADCRLNESPNSCVMACNAAIQWLDKANIIAIMPTCVEVL